MKKLILNTDALLVLLHIKDNGQEDFTSLVESLRFDRQRLGHIIQGLQHKGLIMVSRSTYSDAWIQLSAKGQRLFQGMWPDTAALAH